LSTDQTFSGLSQKAHERLKDATHLLDTALLFRSTGFGAVPNDNVPTST
jgi:hypothetical protein